MYNHNTYAEILLPLYMYVWGDSTYTMAIKWKDYRRLGDLLFLRFKLFTTQATSEKVLTVEVYCGSEYFLWSSFI